MCNSGFVNIHTYIHIYSEVNQYMIFVNIFQVAMLGKKPKPTILCANTVYFLLLKIPDT